MSAGQDQRSAMGPEAESSREELVLELNRLRQEMAELRLEKADLELLLEMNAEHSDNVEAELFDKVEATLRESERRFRLIVETTPVPIIISRLSDGKILYANAQTRPTFGLPVEALLGHQSPDFYYDPADRQQLLETLEQRGHVQNYEVRAKKADGTPFWVVISIRPLMFNDQPCLLSAFYDITERKRAEEERAQFLAIQQELDLARQIQNSLLPPSRPNWPGLDVVCYTVAAHEVGGDFYAYHAFASPSAAGQPPAAQNKGPGSFAITVGDVSGKGMPAALLMAVSFASLQAVIARAFDPGELLTYLDEAIALYTQTMHQNCALCYAEIIPPDRNSGGKEGVMRVANAGCIEPLIRRANGQVEWVQVGGMPLGAGFGAQLGYREATLPLSAGDLVILTSDGVVEAMTSSGEMFGFDRLEQAAASGPGSSAQAMLTHLRTEVAAFVGQPRAQTSLPIHDDLTIVVMQV